VSCALPVGVRHCFFDNVTLRAQLLTAAVDHVGARFPLVGELLRECLHMNDTKRPCSAEVLDRLCAALFGLTLRTFRVCGPCCTVAGLMGLRLKTSALIRARMQQPTLALLPRLPPVQPRPQSARGPPRGS
jgi:hypothetical protein